MKAIHPPERIPEVVKAPAIAVNYGPALKKVKLPTGVGSNPNAGIARLLVNAIRGVST